ncbi:MAG: DUF3137 domain-containing protein [Alphaproteobacteria bacterium]|nr:DUF3137 domain-containing protein [Alphaproteobacteria bacterium]
MGTVMLEDVNVELLEARNEFRKYYDAELRKDYVLLEETRRVYLKRLVLCLVGFLLPVWWWFFVCDEPQDGYWTEGLVKFYSIYGIVAYAICCIPFSAYKEKTKSLVMRKILLFFCSSAKLRKNVIRKYDVQESGLVGAFDDIERDDEFEIVKDGVKIVVSEQEITKTVRTGKGSHKQTLFNGVMMMLDFDKKFKGKIVAKEKGGLLFGTRISGGLIWWLSILPLFIVGAMLIISISMLVILNFGDFSFMSSFFFLSVFCVGVWLYLLYKKNSKIQEVLLEDVVFSKKWKVMGTDQVEARYVLTPALMERLLKVKKCFHGNKLDFAFYDNKLLIAVSTNKDMFETTFLLQKAASYHKVNEVVSQLFAVCSVANLIIRQKK